MESQQEYENRSLREALASQREIERQSLADRRTAQAEYFGHMRDDPKHVAERAGWLLDGNYGYGEMLRAQRELARPRANHARELIYLTGIYEWACPPKNTAAAWKKLTAAQQRALDAAVKREISAWKKRKEE